ncbi:MAG: GAF domain-containing protein [Chloroflexota bacterium]
MVRRSTLRTLILSVLVVLTILVLATNVPTGDSFFQYVAHGLIFAALTVFALVFSARLTQGGLSAAHVIGMVAFLSLPVQALPVMTWMIFVGGAAGAGAVFINSTLRRHVTTQPIRLSLRLQLTGLIIARVTLAFYAAAEVYIALGGMLPLDQMRSPREPLMLAVYSLVYIAVYMSIFVLQMYVDGRHISSILRENTSLLFAVLVLPVPLAILSAEVVGDFSRPMGVVGVIGQCVIVVGLHAISRSDQQLRKQLDEMTTLSLVTRSLRTHLDTDSLLRTIYMQVDQLFDIKHFTLMVYHPESARVTLALIIRDDTEVARTPDMPESLDDYPLIDRVMSTASSLFLPDRVQQRAQDLGITIVAPSYTGWMGVPLLIDEEEVGVLAVARDATQRNFSRGDLRLLSIVADSASIAIENAQLFSQQADRASRMATLNNIASLLSGTLSPDAVLDAIISSASTIGDAHAVALFLSLEDDSTNTLLPLRSAGFKQELVEYPLAPLLAKSSTPLTAQPPLAINDVRSSRAAATWQMFLRSEGLSALVELPLTVGERSLGVLGLYYRTPQQFGLEWMELLRTFANQAAQAIVNARAYTTTDAALQRSVEQLLTLSGISRQLTATIDLRTICQYMLDAVIDTIDIDAGAVALYDANEPGTLEILTEYHHHETVPVNAGALKYGLVSQALDTAQVQRVDDVRATGATPQAYLLTGARAHLSVPIIRANDVLGVIILENLTPGAFTAEDSQFVAQIANQAVIAVDNARLFQRITEARDRLQVILDTMKEAIILIDARGQVVLANPRMSMLGLDPAALLDQSIETLLAQPEIKLARHLGFDNPRELTEIVKHISTPDEWPDYPPRLHSAVTVEQGARYVERQVIPVRDEHAQTIGVLLLFYDKTDEQELETARQELTRMIVHDLRSPLTAVTTSLKLLRDYVPEENPAYNLVQSTTDASRQAVRKLLGRVDSLLDISKMQSGRIAIDAEPVALSTLINNVQEQLRPLSEELRIGIVTRWNGQEPTLNVDADKVERLLLNLLDNALKYSPTSDDIVLEVHAPGTSGAGEGYVRVDVCDRGPGVPDEHKDALFESFVQLEGRQRVRRGVGLGLAFCKLVAEAHGGRIWIEDNRPTGSIFAFTVPMLDALPPGDDDRNPDEEPVDENNAVESNHR